MAALRNAEQELQDHQIKWQELKTSLVQASEDLKKTLQDKEEEWGETESSMKAQLEDLISKRKKKKKMVLKALLQPKSTLRNTLDSLKTHTQSSALCYNGFSPGAPVGPLSL